MNVSDFSNARKRLSQYLDLLKQYQDEGNTNVNMTFDKGYWLSDNGDLSAHEHYFLHTVGDGSEFIVLLRAGELSKKAMADTLCLLGWSKNVTEVGGILEMYMRHDSVSVAAAAARAMFPYVASGKYVPRKDSVIYLLRRRSKFAKNKALGLIAFLPDNVLMDWMDERLKSEISSLTKHKDRFIIGNIATLVMNRLS